MAEQLQKTSSDENYSPEFIRAKRREERRELQFKIQEENQEDYNKEFSKEELHNALKNSNESAPGKDRITFQMIKNLPPTGLDYTLKLMNDIWGKGEFPQEWRHAVVVPIAKPGKDPSNPSNYRPISLTSCICKAMEKMVNVRLSWVIKEKKMLTPTQYGAEKGRSTLDPLIQLEHHIREAFTRKTPTIAIFFDIEKAYDSTWKYPILKKLKENRIDGQLPIFLENFLKNRTFQVRIDSTYSDTFTQLNGIPQGSVLSCTAFKLAVNSIIKELPEKVRKSLFMDDYAVYLSSKRLRQAVRILNLVLKKLEKWAEETGFKFSIDKTKAVAFYRNKRWVSDQNLRLEFYGNEIPIVDSYKFLGIIFDSHLNFKKHTEYVRGKCKKAINLLRKVAHTTWGADRKSLKIIFKATVLAILDYGCQIYGSASEPTLRRLDPIHNEGLRLVTGAFRSSPILSLQVEAGEPPLRIRRELITMKTKTKLIQNNSPTNELFQKMDIYWRNDGREDTAPYPIRANRLLTDIDIQPPPRIATPPPWMTLKASVCTELTKISKKENIPQICRQEAGKHMQSKGRHLAIFTDGSKTNDTVGSAAVTTIATRKIGLPRYATICTAELYAIKEALDIVALSEFNKYVIYTDSKSAIDCLLQFEPSHPIAKQIQSSIHQILTRRNTRIEVCWVPSHVGIPGNEFADKAAKEAAASPPTAAHVPAADFIPHLKMMSRSKWQREWDSLNTPNKLKEIKTDVTEWKSAYGENRSEEVTITRLRIGHTNITHSYLMTNPSGPIPQCGPCGATLTVKHMLAECPRMKAIREKHFKEKSLKEILHV